MAKYSTLGTYSFTDQGDAAHDIRGSHVYGRDHEKLGKIDDVIFDEGTGSIAYTVIETGGWLSSKKFVVPAQAIRPAAGDPDAKVRVAATKTLGELAGPDQLSGLLGLLAKAGSSEDIEAVEQALSAVSLKAANPASCVGQVEARLAQSQPAQKCALLRVLGSIGGTNALQAVRAAVNDSNPEVHAAAIRTLGGWTTADAAPDLLEFAKTAANPTDKMIVLRGYLRLAGQSDLALDKRLSICRQAAPLAQKDEEKKLLLAAPRLEIAQGKARSVVKGLSRGIAKRSRSFIERCDPPAGIPDSP